ncbi:MAG: cytochrome-c peroxidase [Nitrospirae bacterium]|nr:cytochrome-c peroxidase [Nitrospirota bacterium]
MRVNSFLKTAGACVVVSLALSSISYAIHLEPFIFSPMPRHKVQTPAMTELGKKLFFDRRLSGDGTTSCATCHNPEQGYSDGQDISQSYPSTRNWRNSPTLLNIGHQKYLFHDGRAQSLEDQALFPMMSAFEMNQNLDYLEEEIRSVPAYVEEFKKVFGDGDTTKEHMAIAIAAFERTLISENTPLERYLLGDEKALSADAKKGMDIFSGKAKCIECHYGPALADDRFHALNVPENPAYRDDPRYIATMRFVAKGWHFTDYRTLKEDPGRYLITMDRKDWKAFRTPPLLDIAKTAPYMHNGIYATLEETIDFFDRGGGQNNTVLKPLGLTDEEKRLLKVFMVEALSGEDRPFKYPVVP